MSNNLKVKLVKDTLSLKSTKNTHETMVLAEFYNKFDILWKDEEFGFSADDKLICQILSSI